MPAGSYPDTHTHTHDCVNRWCKRGQKGQYFQTEYVISNRCGGKKMVMNKERCAAEKGVQAARSRGTHGCYPALLNRRGEMAATSLVHPLSPIRHVPAALSSPALVSSGTSQSSAQQRPLSTLKVTHGLLQWGQRTPNSRGVPSSCPPGAEGRNTPGQQNPKGLC